MLILEVALGVALGIWLAPHVPAAARYVLRAAIFVACLSGAVACLWALCYVCSITSAMNVLYAVVGAAMVLRLVAAHVVIQRERVEQEERAERAAQMRAEQAASL